MANEIYTRIIFEWDFKLTSKIIKFDRSFRATAIAGTRYNKVLQNVGTAWEAVEIGDLAVQHMVIHNLDDTNFVSWGKSVADATELIRILPGEIVFFNSVATAPAFKANTAACDVEIYGVQGG